MWKKIVSMALDLVAQIEYELKGKTGPEKKKLVIERLATSEGYRYPFCVCAGFARNSH
jgi:hypothetical protein